MVCHLTLHVIFATEMQAQAGTNVDAITGYAPPFIKGEN